MLPLYAILKSSAVTVTVFTVVHPVITIIETKIPITPMIIALMEITHSMNNKLVNKNILICDETTYFSIINKIDF